MTASQAQIRTAAEIASGNLHPFHPLIAAATHDASAAMCRWTGGLVSLTLDEVAELPLETASAEFGDCEEPLAMVVLSVEGDQGGTMILAFDERHGRSMAGAILGRGVAPLAADPGPWTPLETSALCETGNILACAYLNAITRLLGVPLVPTPPRFLHDFGPCVMEQAIAAEAFADATCESILVCRTRFQAEGIELAWNVAFVPSAGLRTAFREALTGVC